MLPPAAAVLTSAWVSLCVVWSVRAVPPAYSAPPLAPWALGLLLLAAMWLTRWAPAQVEGRWRRLVVAGGGIGAVLSLAWLTYGFDSPSEFWRRLVDWGDYISPVFLGVAACAYMWWQGIVLGRSSVPQEQLERDFYRGTAALALIYAVNQVRPLITAEEGLVTVLVFFATGLSALALVSVENARRWQSEVMGHWPAHNRYWLGTVAVVIGGILAIGLLTGLLISPDLFEQVAGILTAVANAVTIAFVAVIGTMVFFTAWLITPVIRALTGRLDSAFVFSPLPTLEETGQQTLSFLEQHPMLNVARQGLSLLVVVMVIGLVFWFALQRFNRGGRRNLDEERDSIATRDLLLAQLRALLFRPRAGPAAASGYLALAGPRDDPRLMVRRTYQTLLEWAPASSLPRRTAGQTPAAYASALAEALPQATDAIDALTHTYVLARYADEAPSLAEAHAAQSALSRVQTVAAARVVGRQ
ncbi:MAG: DUF4129 domain-containing protein [Anaerolineales bacterium]|nr:DUF4129 domain-containing protein [Anaerolineales bacterium]